MKIIAKNRWQAFGIHLLISLVIFLTLCGVILFLWYPGFLFLYGGGVDGMKLIAGVDFVIGPVLTLLVYKPGKKSLRFDLACIALLQLACLTGGMGTVWYMRPVAVVYAAGGFSVTNQSGYKDEKYNIKDIPLISENRWPVWLGVNVSDADAAAASAVWAILGSSFAYNTENYVLYADMVANMKQAGLTHEALVKQAGVEKVKEIGLEQDPAFAGDVRFYPIATTLREGYLAIDTRTGEIVQSFFKKGLL